MFLRTFVIFGALAAACSAALAQGGCTSYHVWNVSGYAGDSPSTPGYPPWFEGVDNAQATYGGIGPTCSYTWIPGGMDPHWSGWCYSIAYTCSTTPLPAAAAAAETSPGPSCQSSNPVPFCGQPINLASGNTYIQQTDLVIPGLGGGLTLIRTWNSLWPPTQSAMSAGMFGNSWRSTYEERIFMGSDGTVKYARADGSFWSLLLYGSPATYHVIAPANVQATLTEQGTTTWTLTFQNGESRVFDYNSGSLISITDRNGNTTQLSYDSLNRLVTITDPASRHLYFSYANSSSSLVIGVSSDVGISLSYVYDSQNRLTTVTKPDQTSISFEYNSSSLITAVKDSNGVILESHTYDSNGRGLTSSRANGVEAVTASYGQQ